MAEVTWLDLVRQLAQLDPDAAIRVLEGAFSTARVPSVDHSPPPAAAYWRSFRGPQKAVHERLRHEQPGNKKGAPPLAFLSRRSAPCRAAWVQRPIVVRQWNWRYPHTCRRMHPSANSIPPMPNRPNTARHRDWPALRIGIRPGRTLRARARTRAQHAM